jgi:hypothetical protein
VWSLFFYLICSDHSAFELDVVHGLFSLSPVRYCMYGVSTVAVHGRVLVCPQGSERGSSRAFETDWDSWEDRPSLAFYGNMAEAGPRLQINQSTRDSLVFTGA